MDSLSPSSQMSSQNSSPDNSSVHNCRVYASFCLKDPNSNINMSNWIECFNPYINSWHRVTLIPGLIENHVLKGFSMVSIGSSLYVIGGRLCHKMVGRNHDDTSEIDLEVLSAVLRYDIDADMWFKCAPLGIPRFDFACTVCDNKIYVAGGQCKVASARGISSAEVYDPTLDEWKPLPKMSTLRYKCVGVTWHDKFHVVGGFTDGGDLMTNIRDRSSAEVYDSECVKWDRMVGMWQLDVPPYQIIDVCGELFSSGDCLNPWKGHIDTYDGNLNIWNIVDGSQFHTLSSPISTSDDTETNDRPIRKLYLTMAPIGERIYFLAGFKKPGLLSRMMSVVHVFDTSPNRHDWTSFDPTEENGGKELCGHCCVVKHVSLEERH